MRKDAPNSHAASTEHSAHPFTTPSWVAERIVELCLAHPGWGCVKLARQLEQEGMRISSPTVQKILVSRALGRRVQRVSVLAAALTSNRQMSLNSEQAHEVSRISPWLSDSRRASQPGELLAQTCILVSRAFAATLRLQLVVDSFSHYCHARLHIGNGASAAIEILDETVVPNYARLGWAVRRIVTNNGSQYCGSSRHLFARYLRTHGITHLAEHDRSRPLTAPLARTRGLLQRTWLSGFAATAPDDLPRLQSSLADWLTDHNHSRIRDDPRVAGARPIDLLRKIS